MTVNANILHDREYKDFAWPWMQRFCMTVNARSCMTANAKIHHDREWKDIAGRWMRRFCMIANANILYERECKDSTWRWMPEPGWTWMNVDERGWTWMSISKRRWPYPISAIMFSPLVLFLLKLLKCLDSNPLSISVPDEGYSRNAPRYNLSTMYCWKWH
jgi:hypothetical protein